MHFGTSHFAPRTQNPAPPCPLLPCSPPCDLPPVPCHLTRFLPLNIPALVSRLNHRFPALLVDAVRAVHAGRLWLETGLGARARRRLQQAQTREPIAQGGPGTLSTREREVVRFGIARGDADGGLKLARALAMTTYRTPREFEVRFSGSPRRDADRHRLPIEDYLFARGDAYVAQYRPESFVALSESIDLFEIDPSVIGVPTTAVAVPEDELVPYRHMQEYVERLPQGTLVTLDSIYGHDAFLKEGEALKPIFASVIEAGSR